MTSRSWRDRLLGEDPRTVGADPDPRLSFANERTFLAWARTALALISVGLAITQLLPPFDVHGGRLVIGLPLIVLGTAVTVVAARNWSANERAMRLGQSLPSSWLGVALTIVVGVVGILALVITLVWGQR
jgi:putative membrane protein